jgi:hypothetical protein
LRNLVFIVFHELISLLCGIIERAEAQAENILLPDVNSHNEIREASHERLLVHGVVSSVKYRLQSHKSAPKVQCAIIALVQKHTVPILRRQLAFFRLKFTERASALIWFAKPFCCLVELLIWVVVVCYQKFPLERWFFCDDHRSH